VLRTVSDQRFIGKEGYHRLYQEAKALESHKLYVGNLKHTVTEDDLKELFSGFGTIKEIEVVGGRGFGFVTFATLEGAERARGVLAGKEFEGRTLRVEDARPVFLSGERHPESII